MKESWHVQDELLSDKVAGVLRKLIVERSLKPGSRLIQEEIAENMGVSRMPIRDALKRLAMEGLVELDARKGAFVKPITREVINEAYTLRAQLEPLGVKLSGPLLEPQHIETLEELVVNMEKAVQASDRDSFTELNRKFHEMLRVRCPWPRLNLFIENLWSGLSPYTPVFVEGQAQRSHEEHLLMMHAIRSTDWETLADICKTHIERSRDGLLNFLQEEGFFQPSGSQ